MDTNLMQTANINSLNPKLWLNVQSSTFFYLALAVCPSSQAFEQKNIANSSVVLLFMHMQFSC